MFVDTYFQWFEYHTMSSRGHGGPSPSRTVAAYVPLNWKITESPILFLVSRSLFFSAQPFSLIVQHSFCPLFFVAENV